MAKSGISFWSKLFGRKTPELVEPGGRELRDLVEKIQAENIRLKHLTATPQEQRLQELQAQVVQEQERAAAETLRSQQMQVELQDATGKPLPGFALQDCDELFGDTHDRSVVWNSQADLASLAGQVVRVRFVLHDADLYSYQFRD